MLNLILLTKKLAQKSRMAFMQVRTTNEITTK